MDKYGCDYECRTVGESIIKYDIPDDWGADFYALDDIYPIVCIPVEEIRKSSKMMALKLKVIEDQDNELAGCMVYTDLEIIAFKIDYMRDLIKAMQAE